jgi:hypothetical protein
MGDSGHSKEERSKAEVEALEERVRIMELRAREIEAELRLIKGQAERREMMFGTKKQLKGERKARNKSERKAKKKTKAEQPSGDHPAGST